MAVILKEKKFTNPSDSRLRAGDEAEKQLAFRLQRAFKKREDVFVINDLRIVYDGDAAQIDHLIVSPYGLYIIESKSCYGIIAVNKFNEWSRTYNGKSEGMPSPILQAEEQGRVLKALLIANREVLLGKMLGGIAQRGFAYCPVLGFVAVSDTGMIERDGIVEGLYKSDDVIKAVAGKLDEIKGKADLLSPKFWLTTDVVWWMKVEEAKNVAEFLVMQHQPIPKKLSASQSEGVCSTKVLAVRIENSFVPKVGAMCPKCGVSQLVRKSIKRSDETETDFLACQGYPDSCKALFPLVAVAHQAAPSNETPIPHVSTSNVEGELCPKCGVGKKVRRKGRLGKPDFYGCSNYGKTKCRFQETIT